MKPKPILIISIAFLILLLVLSGCRRLERSASSALQTAGISMIPEISQQSAVSASSTAASQTENSPETTPADSKEVGETLDQILSELAGLDSVYSQIDTVSDSDLSN